MPSSICAIIPTFNRAAMLRECIDSILAQSHPIEEIIVVNDGSTDDTENVVKSYGNRVTLISKKNGGKPGAINVALAQCTSDYVWICDDDDLAAPDGIEHLAAALDADKTLGFAFGTFKIFRDDAAGRTFIPPTYWAREEEPNITINFLEEMFTFQFAMLVRRSLYLEVGPFREDMIRSEDYSMTLRLCRDSKAVYVPKVIFFQRQHAGIRGAAADLFSAAKNAQKWLIYDQKIFIRARQNFRLDEFTPTFALQWDGALAKRAALVERACVFAHRALWDEAISDFREAAALSSAPAAPEEIRIAEAVIRNPLSWQALGNNRNWVASLRACYKMNGYGRSIILAACRPLVWHARQMLQNGDVAGGIKMLRILIGVTGIRGMFARILSSLLG